MCSRGIKYELACISVALHKGGGGSVSKRREYFISLAWRSSTLQNVAHLLHRRASSKCRPFIYHNYIDFGKQSLGIHLRRYGILILLAAPMRRGTGTFQMQINMQINMQHALYAWSTTMHVGTNNRMEFVLLLHVLDLISMNLELSSWKDFISCTYHPQTWPT